MKIPWREIDAQTLHGLLNEIASREGTDYGEMEVPMDVKVEQLKAKLQKNEVVLFWDVNSESASILPREEENTRNQNVDDGSGDNDYPVDAQYVTDFEQ